MKEDIERLSYKKMLEGTSIGIVAGAILSEIVFIFTDSTGTKLTVAFVVGFIVFLVSVSVKD